MTCGRRVPYTVGTTGGAVYYFTCDLPRGHDEACSGRAHDYAHGPPLFRVGR